MRSRTRSWKESSKRKLAGSMVGGTVLAQLEVLEAIEEILNWLVVTPVKVELFLCQRHTFLRA